MNEHRPFRHTISRRDLLRHLGIGSAALASIPLLNACGVGGSTSGSSNGEASNEVTGDFDWRREEGTTLSVLQTPHAYQQTYQPFLGEFTELTGIELDIELVPEADYFTRLNTELSGGSGGVDVFMLGAYFIWQYGPPGFLEDLGPWIENESATDPEYDFEDIFEGLRNATRWDFELGSPIGTGGQWALPWGFETNVIAYNKKYFDDNGIQPAETFDDLIQLAIDLTDRDENRYGIGFRGSRSWATIHPGFMTQYSREGAQDYINDNGQLVAAMNSPEAVDFTQKWAELAREAGPSGWTTYEYPDVMRDLGNGTAMMAFDADSASYPQNVPGASAEAGNLGWHAGPAGPDGSLATNLWTWALAMNAGSERKSAGWLFLQWATGKEAMTRAVESGTFSDPTRASVFEGAFRQTLGDFPGYEEAFERVIDDTTIHFTPQTSFFETTEEWSVALQEIYEGADAQSRLDSLAESNTDIVNG